MRRPEQDCSLRGRTGADRGLMPSAVQPLATLQAAIEAVEAEVGEGDPCRRLYDPLGGPNHADEESAGSGPLDQGRLP